MAKTESLTAQQIENTIKKKDFAPIYLLMGEESFYIDRIADLIIDNALSPDERDFNLSIYYGVDANIPDIILACRRYPVMAERQVVVLREANTVRNRADLDLFQHYAKNPLKSTILVICYKGGTVKSGPLTKSLTAKMDDGKPVAIIFDSKRFTEYNIRNAVASYVRSIGCTIEDKAQAMLIEYVGLDFSHLAKEIDKLKQISPNNIRITADMIEQNIGISKNYNNFELIKAIAAKDHIRCIKIIKYFKENAGKNPTALTASVLFNYFANMLLIYYAPAKDDHTLLEHLRLKFPNALKDYRIGLSNYSAMKCLRIIGFIREFDAQSKGIGSLHDEHDLLLGLILKILNI